MPYFVQGVTTAPPVGSYPSGAFPLLQVSDLRTAYIEPDPGACLQHEMESQYSARSISGWVADIGYTGSRGVHLPQVERNMNTVIPEQQPDGTWVYPAGKPKLNTNFSTINTTDTWNTDSYYHGLQVSVKKIWRSGIHIQSSYAYAKSIDTASSTGSTAAGSGYSGARAVPTPLLPGSQPRVVRFRHAAQLQLQSGMAACHSQGLQADLQALWPKDGNSVRSFAHNPDFRSPLCSTAIAEAV